MNLINMIISFFYKVLHWAATQINNIYVYIILFSAIYIKYVLYILNVHTSLEQIDR